MKVWYAVLKDNTDNDWGYGSYNKHIAAKMVRQLRRNGNNNAYIAIISNDICIKEIHDIKYM